MGQIEEEQNPLLQQPALDLHQIFVWIEGQAIACLCS